MDVDINFDEERKVTYSKIEFTPEIDALLQGLKAKDIT
jgi:hypothetical protein